MRRQLQKKAPWAGISMAVFRLSMARIRMFRRPTKEFFPVATADWRVLPGGTAFHTDVGMCGPLDSVIGMERETVIKGFLNQLPRPFEVAQDNVVLQGAVVDVDEHTGRAKEFRRLRVSWQEAR